MQELEKVGRRETFGGRGLTRSSPRLGCSATEEEKKKKKKIQFECKCMSDGRQRNAVVGYILLCRKQ
jgi:hypothetical protein